RIRCDTSNADISAGSGGLCAHQPEDQALPVGKSWGVRRGREGEWPSCGVFLERDGGAHVLLPTRARKYLNQGSTLKGGSLEPRSRDPYRRRGSFLIPAASSWRTPPSQPRALPHSRR